MTTQNKKKIIKTKRIVKRSTKKAVEPVLAADRDQKNVIETIPNRKYQGDIILTTGKRKTSVARTKFFTNTPGEIIVNNKIYTQYFPYFEWQQIIERPLRAVDFLKKGSFVIKVNGGGIKGQAEAVSLGIARALIILNQEFRKTLKPLGLLSRDSRIKERKKPGLKRARRAPQWTKR